MTGGNTQIVHFHHLPDLPHIQAVRGTDVGSPFPRHVHEGFCFGLVQKGTRILHQRGKSTVIPENALFVINPSTAHTCQSQKGGHSYMALSITASFMRDIASGISAHLRSVPHFEKVLINDARLTVKFRRLFSLFESAESVFETESVLLALLSQLILNHSDRQPVICGRTVHDRTITGVCEFIRMNYARRLTLGQLAREACLSPFYFQRIFLEKTGVSPHEYLLACRMKKARQFLSEGYSLAQVALNTGFADQSHFTRSFLRVMGITPGHYRREALSERRGKSSILKKSNMIRNPHIHDI